MKDDYVHVNSCGFNDWDQSTSRNTDNLSDIEPIASMNKSNNLSSLFPATKRYEANKFVYLCITFLLDCTIVLYLHRTEPKNTDNLAQVKYSNAKSISSAAFFNKDDSADVRHSLICKLL